jgi:putative redox protein
MEITVKHLDQVRFSIQARGHEVICDQPADNGGEDAGMTPPEFLLASLGSCAAFYAVQYLKTRGLDSHGVEVKVTAEKLKPPARLGNFVIHVANPAELSDEHREGLNRAVHACLIHNTLLNPPAIAIELELGAAVTVAAH